MKWIIVSGCKAEAFCSALMFGAVTVRYPLSSLPSPPALQLSFNTLRVYYWCGNSYFHHAADILYFWSLWLQSHYSIQHFPITGVCRVLEKLFLWKFQANGVMTIVTWNIFFFIHALPVFWGFALIKRARLPENELRALLMFRSAYISIF